MMNDSLYTNPCIKHFLPGKNCINCKVQHSNKITESEYLNGSCIRNPSLPTAGWKKKKSFKIQNIQERDATLTVLKKFNVKDYLKNKLFRKLYDWISSMKQELHNENKRLRFFALVNNSTLNILECKLNVIVCMLIGIKCFIF